MFSISPLRNSTFLYARLALVFVGEGEHLVGHVEAVGFAGWTDTLSRKQHINAAAGAQIEHGFAGIQVRQRGGIAAAERRQQSFLRDLRALRGVVKIGGDGIAAAGAGGGAAARTASGLHAQSGLAVLFFDDFL